MLQQDTSKVCNNVVNLWPFIVCGAQRFAASMAQTLQRASLRQAHSQEQDINNWIAPKAVAFTSETAVRAYLHKADGAAADQVHEMLHAGLRVGPASWRQLDGPDLHAAETAPPGSRILQLSA